MNFFHLNSDDLHWLKRWLIKHLSMLALIASIWLLVRGWPEAVPRFHNAANADDVVVVDQSADQEEPIPPVAGADYNLPLVWIEDGPQGIRLAQIHGGQLISVPPTGWRRTRNGWENTATWRPTLASLGDIVRQQQQREPIWMRNVLSQVRSVPPWAVAILQIVAVVVVLAVSGRKPENQPALETDSTEHL
jgi:hypothetical protein